MTGRPAESAGTGPYTLGPGDAVEIHVGDEPSLSGLFKISQEGTVVYPMLGVIQVSGLDVGRLAQMIRERLEKDYIIKPQVAAYIVTYGSKSVSVLGEMITAPGVYALKEDSTLLAVLTEAGFKATDSDATIVIRRQEVQAGKGQKSVDAPPVVLSLSALTSAWKSMEPAALQAGDQIFVVAKKISVMGDMLSSPGVFPLKADTTVLSLLAEAGFKATDSDVTLIVRHREVPAEKGRPALEPPPTVVNLSRLTSAWEGSEPVALNDGDQVFVVAKVRGKIVVSGRVKKPGKVPLTDGLTVWEALNSAGGVADFGDSSDVRVIRDEQGRTVVLQMDLTSVDKGIRSNDIPLKDGDIVVVPKRWF
jgi:polysaccharide export outer membrane protein